MNYHQHKACIEACLACAALCNHCASSCTGENDVTMMAQCIQLDMECAVTCYATAQLLSLGSDLAKDITRICAEICTRCAEECSKHDNEHCRECADACRKCAEACKVV